MGNTACCAATDGLRDVANTNNMELNKAEAVPVVDESEQTQTNGVSSTMLRTNSPANEPTPVPPTKAKSDEGSYVVNLSKSDGDKLGLDVDFMQERRILPITGVTGGLAEAWNQKNPDKQIKKGDAIVEVNTVRISVWKMLEKCKAESSLDLTLVRNFSFDHLVADLEDLIKTRSCGPILVRLSWHDAGVFSEGKGGCPNAALRFKDAGEGAFAANAGLPTVALDLLRPISDKFCPDLISHADLWVLAANTAIRVMGGPEVPTRFGRVDARSADDGVTEQAGRLPDGDKGCDHLRAIFHAKGFDDKAIVALSGAHTLGRCHIERSGFDGAWTEDPLAFDNTYFKELLSKSYVPEVTAKGCPQHRHGASKTMMLNSDLALLKDTGFKKHVESYANNQELWFTDFAAAFSRLQELGCEALRNTL